MRRRGRERTRKRFCKKNVSRHFCRLGSDVKNSRQSLFQGLCREFLL